MKSAYPGESSRLTLTPSCSNGASDRLIERCWRASASSKSLTVVPSSTRPARGIVPVATSRASTSVVLPAPEWPTSTTLRIRPGSSAVGALPAAPDALPPGTCPWTCRPSGRLLVTRCSGQPAPVAARRTRWLIAEPIGSVSSPDNARHSRAAADQPGGRADWPVGWRALGVTPDALTVIGTIGVAGGALGFYPRGKFFVGTLVITAFVFSDMLDGAVARVTRHAAARGGRSSTPRSTGSVTGRSSVRWRSGTPATGNNLTLCAVALYDLVAGVVTSYAKARAESLGMTANVGIAERARAADRGPGADRASRGCSTCRCCGRSRCGGSRPLPPITVVQRMVEVRRQSRPGTPTPPAPPVPTSSP